MDYDFEYVCNGIAEIARIPIRVYKGSSFLSFHSPIPFKIDPALPYIDSLLESDSPIKYYITPLSQYYGIVHIEDYSLIMGPSSEHSLSDQAMASLIRLLEIPETDTDDFIASTNAITRLPVPMFLQVLSFNYYFFTHQKIDVSDLLISKTLETTEPQNISIKTSEAVTDNNSDQHTTLDFERNMLNLVKRGDVHQLEELFATASVGLAGKVGTTYLNQLKNIFVTTATLVSRSAIEGGLPMEEALHLSDHYITHCDKLTKAEYILNLQYNMVMDFTKRIHSLYKGHSYSKPVRNAIGYIHDHLNEPLTIEDICSAASMSRSQLSSRFKEETGTTITEFIRNHKIDVAKDLLTQTDMSLLDISISLGFSSQSHFQKTFRDVTGVTPKKFKSLH